MSVEYETPWDQSYARRENTLFYPSEPVIRFVNKFIRRRVGPDEYTRSFDGPPRVLDIGSGAGRHLLFLAENGFHPIGVEFSGVACEQARTLLSANDVPADRFEILQTSSERVAVPDGTVDYAISTGTFDSMPTATAERSAAEVHRALKGGALFYVDVISTDSVRHGDDLGDDEYVVSEQHEQLTVQSHYDDDKIDRVFAAFETLEQIKIVSSHPDGTIIHARWHLVLRKPD